MRTGIMKTAIMLLVLAVAAEHFLECRYEEEGEDITFTYTVDGKKTLEEILNEEKEVKYRILINFAALKDAYMRHRDLKRREGIPEDL